MRKLFPLSVFAVLVIALGLAACNRTEKGTTGSAGGTAGTASAPTPAPAPAAPTAPETAAAPASSSETPVAASDRRFVASAANSGLAEVEASRYVADKSGNADLKTFARQLEREHASANDELMRLAGTKGLTVPSAVEGEEKGLLDKLRDSSPDQVDRNFLQDFGVDTHQKAILLFELQARDGSDQALRSFAEKTLPKLREQLAMARQLQGKMP